ncbi:hypothetical protein C4577_07475 [Candidatus Parcubacteria bacterium]|nr:MAG: hypothetical protein C4577_07475 [Candidatus Parcubacteria bacterium]
MAIMTETNNQNTGSENTSVPKQKNPNTQLKQVKDEIKKEPKNEIESKTSTAEQHDPNSYYSSHDPYVIRSGSASHAFEKLDYNVSPAKRTGEYQIYPSHKKEEIVVPKKQKMAPVLRNSKEKAKLKSKVVTNSNSNNRAKIGISGKDVLNAILNGNNNYSSISREYNKNDSNLKPSSVSGILQRLIKNNLIERIPIKPKKGNHPNTNQGYQYLLTPEGVLEIGVRNGWSDRKIVSVIEKIEKQNQELIEPFMAKITESMELDTRPNEMIPEDYYA